MSARYLRKVLKEQEEQNLKSAELNESDSDSPNSPPPSRNPFDLLDDDEQGVELEIANETSEADVDKQEPTTMKNGPGPLPSSNRKSKKKKKKTKEDPRPKKDKPEKSLDAILESLNINPNSSSHQVGSINAKAENALVQDNFMSQCVSILEVDPKFLRPENELRRIFGSDVVRSFENSHNSASSRQIRGGRRGGHNPRKSIFVSPSANWPRWDGSFSMEFLETKGGKQFFKYVHTPSYTQSQRAFEAAKAIHDLDSIAAILAYEPYHIEALLTISDVLKFSGEHESSAGCISKCLYAMECAWHPMFRPLQGNCQLKYSHDTNKPLFSVLFTHMQNMDRRGCHRSALEVCKLLLSLDSDDPMGAMFCIDYFSLRAEEYSWLERFSEEYKDDNSLWLFPNFSYSLAICRFYLEREANAKGSPIENEKATAIDLMKQALMLHPLVLKKLVEKAPLKDPAWTKILKHGFFGSARPGGPSLERLIDIYVERSYIMWRLPDLQTFLRDAAQLVIETLDHNATEAKDWACVRKETFSSDKNEYSHLSVSDFSSSVPTMPPDELRGFIQPQMAQAMQNGDHGANPEIPVHAPREVANRNPVLVFLESMLPWVEYRDGMDANQHGDHDQENID